MESATNPTTWYRLADLCSLLGVTRRTVSRRVARGDVEVCEVGGSRMYRPVMETAKGTSGDGDTSLSGRESLQDVPGDDPDLAPVPAREVLDLVAKYETRIDAMLARERAQNDRERELADKAAALATAVAHEQNAAQAERHARQLQALEAQSALVTMRQRAERAERELELANTPWWQWGKRRRLLTVMGALKS